MINHINNFKKVIDRDFDIKDSAITAQKYFLAEEYPAICYDPTGQKTKALKSLNSWSDDKINFSICYYDKATENRDMTDFINNADAIADALCQDYKINIEYVNLAFSIKYSTEDYQDNTEFIAQISIKGQVAY